MTSILIKKIDILKQEISTGLHKIGAYDIKRNKEIFKKLEEAKRALRPIKNNKRRSNLRIICARKNEAPQKRLPTTIFEKTQKRDTSHNMSQLQNKPKKSKARQRAKSSNIKRKSSSLMPVSLTEGIKLKHPKSTTKSFSSHTLSRSKRSKKSVIPVALDLKSAIIPIPQPEKVEDKENAIDVSRFNTIQSQFKLLEEQIGKAVLTKEIDLLDRDIRRLGNDLQKQFEVTKNKVAECKLKKKAKKAIREQAPDFN